MSLTRRVKHLVRPLIPDRLMARYRLRQHSREARVNVDVVLPADGRRRRWRRTTPDTYRFVAAPQATAAEGLTELTPAAAAGMAAAPGDTVLIAPEDLDDRTLGMLVSLLEGGQRDVAMIARVERPRLIGGRRDEPAMEPIALATSRTLWEEVTGPPPGRNPLTGFVARLRDAGRSFAVIPLPTSEPTVRRTDPIDGPSAVVMTAVPMHDVGGGSRPAQLALEFLHRGYHVTYVTIFGSAESEDLGLRYVHPRLEQVRRADFEPARLAARLAGHQPRLAIVELPAAPVVSMARSLHQAGFRIVYDLIDDWSDRSLGAEWYRPDAEAELIGIADALVGSAPDLVARLRAPGRPEPVLVPNAVNTRLFAGDHAQPPGLPGGDGPRFGYHGSLYGSWFDWAALGRLAVARPDATILVIGDDTRGPPPLPANVRFLGLKPQAELPGYLQALDVGIVPFVESEVTHAVSPLKVYEYLASGVPVAAPPLRALAGLDGVSTDTDLVAAVAAAERAGPPDRERALTDHGWGRRVTDLLDAAGMEPASPTGPEAVTVVRPAVHWTKEQRG